MRWRNVVGYEGIYAVSEYGDIKSIIGGQGRRNGKIKNSYVNYCGYPYIGLHTNGKQRKFLVHRLVAAAFIGPLPDGKEVNHIDGIKTNNHYTNLEYVSHKKNMRHTSKMGLYASTIGEYNSNSKLTNENVRWIKQQFRKPFYSNNKCAMYLRIARKFNVSRHAISNIIRGRTWKEVPTE